VVLLLVLLVVALVELERLLQLMQLRQKDLAAVVEEVIVVMDPFLERHQVVVEQVVVDLIVHLQRQLLEQLTLVVVEADMVEVTLLVLLV
jgi:hypothetical protein